MVPAGGKTVTINLANGNPGGAMISRGGARGAGAADVPMVRIDQVLSQVWPGVHLINVSWMDGSFAKHTSGTKQRAAPTTPERLAALSCMLRFPSKSTRL